MNRRVRSFARMYTEDYLLRMIQRFAEAVARWAGSGSAGDKAEAEEALQATLGLSLSSLDALPAAAILSLLHPGDDLATERVAAVATLLETLAELEGGPQADARRGKAAALRSALPAHG